MIVGSAQIDVGADLKNFDKDVRTGIGRSLKGAEAQAEKSGRAIGGRLSAGIGTGLAALGIGALLKGAVQEASGLAEQVDGVSRIFGEASEDVLAFGENAAEGLGQSNREALTAAANFGALFRAMDFTEEASARMSIQLTTLASDLASFRDTPVEDALLAIRSGLVGESEPLRRFGVQLSQARLEEEALTLGLIRNKSQLDANAKAQAALSIIMKDTALAQGNFADTSDSAANQQRILAAQVDNLQAKLGSDLLPLFRDLLGVAQVLVGAFAALPDPIREVAVAMGILGVAIKGLGLAGLVSGLAGVARALPGIATGIKAIAEGAVALGGVRAVLQAIGVSGAGVAGVFGGIAAAAVGIGAGAIKAIERLKDIDSVSAAAANEGEGLIRALKRVGASDQEINDVAEAFNKLRKEGKVNEESLNRLAANSELLFDAVKNGGDVVEVLTAILTGDEQAMAKLRGEYDKTRGSTEGLTDATKELTEEQKKAADARERLNRAIRDSERSVDRAETRLERAREDAAQRVSQANKDVTEAIEERDKARADAERRLAEARKDASESIKDARKRLADFEVESAERVADAERNLVEVRRERTNSIVEAQIALERAQFAGDAFAENAARLALTEAQRNDKIKDAERALGEERKDQAKGTKELSADLAKTQEEAAEKIAEAQRNLAEVYEDTAERVAEALQAVADAQEDASRSIADASDSLNEALERQEESVGDAAEAFAPYREELKLTTDQLREMQQAVVDLTFPLPPGFRALLLEDGSIKIVPRATGGPLLAGQIGLVGEDGPELVNFGRHANITSHADLVAALRELMGGRSTSGTSVVQNIVSHQADARVLANELRFRLMEGVTS